MLDGKFIATLLGLIAAIAAVSSIKAKEEKEGFAGLPNSMTWKVDRTVAKTPQLAKKGDFFSVPGTYQSMLAPRGASVNYGSNINYNMPSYEYQGIPKNPLTFSALAGQQNAAVAQSGRTVQEAFTQNSRVSGAVNQMRHNPNLKEGYCACASCAGNCAGNGVPRCGTGAVPEFTYKGGAPVQEAGYADGNYNQVLENVYKGGQASVSSLPVNDMTSMGADMQEAPVVYDRLMFANRVSRLRSQGDPIRGDLAIVPAESGWFRPSVQPNVDLQQGALAVMGSMNNDQGQKLAKLIYTSSGGGETAISGVNIPHADFNNVNMSTMYAGSLGMNQHDVNISAFP